MSVMDVPCRMRRGSTVRGITLGGTEGHPAFAYEASDAATFC